jgi:hypothetical protein
MKHWTDILRRYVRDSQASWSCGSFGAIAEFTRDPGEDAEISEDSLPIVTARGGMRHPRRRRSTRRL